MEQMCRFLTDVWNRCTDLLNESLQMAVQIQGQGPWDLTNKLLVKSQDKKKPVVLVVQMVRALAWTARGVGTEPHPVLPSSLLWIVCEKILIY